MPIYETDKKTSKFCFKTYHKQIKTLRVFFPKKTKRCRSIINYFDLQTNLLKRY